MKELLLTTLVAAGLAGVLVIELRPGRRPEQAAASPPRPVPVAAPLTGPVNRSDLLPVLLARPLFSATRRGPDRPAPVATDAPAAPLPRMTGILIDGSRRSAIFAPAGSKTVAVAEGGRIGSFTVQHIDAQRVTVVGPDGERTIRTSFDASLPPPVAPPPAAPSGLALISPPPVPGAVPGSVPVLGARPGLPFLPGAAR